MLYRKIKKSGDELSILGFGCMRLPQKRGTPGDGKIDEKSARRLIECAVDQGVNYFDTAIHYHMGGSELFLGKVFGRGNRDSVKLATKLPPFHVNKPEDMAVLLKAQLKKLNTDRIDYYLLHAMNRKNWDKLKGFGVLDFLEESKKKQLIINAGFSFHGDPDTFKEIIDSYDWTICQIQYNYLDEQNQAGEKGLKYAASKDVGVIIMEPLRGGNIAGRVPPEVEKIWEESDIKRTPAEWAFRWLWNQPEVSVVLSGMNEEDHLKENIRVACEGHPESLTDDELKLIQRVKNRYKELMKVVCTGCNYCMPCPSGVNIPSCFEFYNNAYMFNDKRTAKLWYLIFLAGIGGDPACASLCQKCGECEKICPQNLAISDNLELVAKEFEGRGMRILKWIFKRALTIQRWREFRRAKKSKKN